jgi:hypothetical protein
VTDQQFAKLLERLDAIERRLPPSVAPVREDEIRRYPQPLPWQPYDGLPASWTTTVRD